MILEPGNIYSGNKKLAVFTNPTELAFKKGCLKNHYPIQYNGMEYADVEQAYQFLSRGHLHDFPYLKSLMVNLIVHKLCQHPRIFRVIRENGGVEWIFKCSHKVRKYQSKRWEGVGRNSVFLQCLANAYRVVEADVNGFCELIKLS